MLLNVSSNSLSTTLIFGLDPFYLAVKTCLILIFHRSFALETQMEEKVDCQARSVIMYSRHSAENHTQWLVSTQPNKMFEVSEN